MYLVIPLCGVAGQIATYQRGQSGIIGGMNYKIMLPDQFGNKLEVLQELPEKGDKFPTIIMVPGFGNDLHELGYFDEVSLSLVQHGFQTLRFSFEGTGQSQGAFLQMTVESQMAQLQDVIAYTQKDRFTLKNRIGLLAQQFGAAITIASLPHPEISSMVFSGALLDPENTLTKWFRRERGYNPLEISKRGRGDRSMVKVGPQVWKSLPHFNYLKLCKNISTPILFVHGGKDQYTKPAVAYEGYNLATGPKKFQLIEKADHAFTKAFRDTAIDLICTRFTETLSANL
jgi:hypothetical protein